MTHVYIVNRDLTNVRHMIPVLFALDDVSGITIVDTESTNPKVEQCYSELIRQYGSSRRPRLEILRVKNDGPKTPFSYLSHSDKFFVVTDGDLHIGNFRLGAITRMAKRLDADPTLIKVGCGLKISDLTPTGNTVVDEYRAQVVAHESQFWKDPIDDDWYRADIDTTFAVYRSSSPSWLGYGPALRDGQNIASHLPWYMSPEDISDEYLFYLRNVGTGAGHTHWTRYLINTALDRRS